MNMTSSKDVLTSPPGNQIKINTVSFNGEIAFQHKPSKKPLPPLAEASISESGQVQVEVIVFIDASIPQPDFNVYQLYCISNSGDPKLQFFIEYDIKETSATELKAYQLTFKVLEKYIPASSKLTDIKAIEVFSWNEDPVTSRGTETIILSN